MRKRDKRKFNCGTSYRWVTITISENLCEACIIQENQISLTLKKKFASRISRPQNRQKPVFGEGGEGRSGYEAFAERRKRNGASFFDDGQAIKSARGMPWHQEPTKDVTSCDKLRGGANIH